MRLTSLKRALTAGLVATTALVWAGCSSKQQTEYVTGISTQVQVPRDMRGIRISVSVGGFTTFCRGYRAYNGVVQLPRSLGTFAMNDPRLSGPITYSVVGYSSEIPEDEEGALEGCQDVAVGKADTRIIRRSRQPYVPEKILFLPLPLKYSCFDKQGCDSPELTCKAGRCVPADTLTDTLPEFREELVDGSGGACFRVQECLGASKPAVVVDPNDCTYAIANTPSEPPLVPGATDILPGGSLGEGVNVLISYDGGLNQEVLDKDQEEGFLIPDPSKPQRFRLAPGLCDMVKGFDEQGKPVAHRITAVRASEVCRAKDKYQPICANDQLQLMGLEPNGTTPNLAPAQCTSTEIKPPETALMVVVDNTQGHSTFFDAAETQGLKLSLDDPAFSRTKIGLVYAPGSLACGAGAPDIPLQAASTAKTKIVASFGEYSPPTPSKSLIAGAPTFEGALDRAYTAVGAEDAFRRAVLVIGNRDFNPATDQCVGSAATPVTIAQNAKTGASNIDTYVILLALTQGTSADAAQALVEGDQLASAGGTTNATDGRGPNNKDDAKDRFQAIVESLATCIYDVDDDPSAGNPAPPTAGVLSYSDPLLGQTHLVSAGACATEGAPGKGWGYGPDPKPKKKRIFLCKDSCDEYRNVLKQASTFNLTFNQPSPAIPVFAHKPGCAPKP